VKSVTWKCPSNIALVKYWGKKGKQLPANPSISFTLDQCHTITTLSFKEKEHDGTLLVSFAFDGKSMPSFEPKLEAFFNNVEDLFPFLPGFLIEINTTNTFPHSSGIASSASGMAALALCLCSMEKELGHEISEADFFRKASKAARLGSGSACRSVYGPLVLWGQTKFNSLGDDEYAIPVKEIHPVFNNFCDTILIVEEGSKSVSSSVGHSLIDKHPFAENRFKVANVNIGIIMEALQKGDLETFRRITENEAMMLHALMLSSDPAYILMKPNTLAIIESVWEHRKNSGLNMMVTLDAGANVHLLYPDNEKESVRNFINKQLLPLCKNGQMIHDTVGLGPVQL
jgi:diphosphomevalonate decarboxylase